MQATPTADGKPDFFMFGEVALDGSDAAAKSFTSHYTTHDGMQAILDFPFQDAARGFASKRLGNQRLAQFFANDDWYTDARLQRVLAADLPRQPRHGPDRLLPHDRQPRRRRRGAARPRPARHELMYFSRGNPVVYYGDEQGFTGAGGDQLARQTMFASQVPEYQDDDQIGTDRTGADDNFVTDHPLYRSISELAALTDAHPALRDGAEQVRYASDGPGVFAFSRIDRAAAAGVRRRAQQQRAAASARVPTYSARAASARCTAPARPP